MLLLACRAVSYAPGLPDLWSLPAALQVTELESVVAHLLKRESSYRAALAELQEALDAKEGARKKVGGAEARRRRAGRAPWLAPSQRSRLLPRDGRCWRLACPPACRR